MANKDAALQARIESIFTRHPSLCGFSVQGIDELPDDCPRSAANGAEFFIGDVGLSLPLSAKQRDKIFREIVAALGEWLAEHPEAGEVLRGRTFARVLH